MTNESRVVWAEGLFLRAHHFQQQERFIEALVRRTSIAAERQAYGFHKLTIDEAALAAGSFQLVEAEGVLPDGTPFAMPASAERPEALAFEPDAAEGVIHLALADRGGSALYGHVDPEREPVAPLLPGQRFRVRRAPLRDELDATSDPVSITVADPALLLVRPRASLDGLTSMPVARVAAVRSDRQIVLDRDFLPPCTVIDAHPYYASLLREQVGRLEQLAEARARFARHPRSSGAGDVQDLLVLQIANRLIPEWRHDLQQGRAHPERLYRALAGAAGELAALATEDRRAPELEPYAHNAPYPSFAAVVDRLNAYVQELMATEEKAVRLPVRRQPSGVWAVRVDNPEIVADSSIVLVVEMATRPDVVRQLLTERATIGPVNQFRDMWLKRLRGIPAEVLHVAPRQIPLISNALYFELDRTAASHGEIGGAGGFAVGISGEVPETPPPNLEAWVVKG